MSDTLGDALPREMARVRDKVLPYYTPEVNGQFAAAMMRKDLDAAANAMAEGDTIEMLRRPGEAVMVAALFVQTGGAYFGLPDVDPWDEKRDARLYDGPHGVVAHPPCSRWCRLAGLVEKRWGHKRGDDGGCFASALASVRRWGGVLEHPAYSDAWAAHDLNAPPTGGGWVNADLLGGWTCYVEQHRYGHPAKKATWLYACGVELPSLEWGCIPDGESRALVSWCGNHVKSGEVRPRVGKARASATPARFKEALLAIARSAQAPGLAPGNASNGDGT